MKFDFIFQTVFYEFLEFQSTDDENFNLLYEATNYLNRKADVMNFYNVDRVLWAAGLCVDSKLRGRGIATEILKARAPLMKKIGVELTTSLFSTVGAQKAASAASYDENYSIAYEDLQKVFPKMDFSNVLGTTSKILSLKV